jgi:hypothetical protein
MKNSHPAPQPVTIIHRGPLTMSSLDSSLRVSLFRPAGKGSDTHSLHMGWEHVTFQNQYMFKLENLQFATAEGIVTLAAMVDCLRNGTQSKVDVLIGSDSKSWSSALHLEQLMNDRWQKSFPIIPSNVEGGLTHPLWRYPVNSRNASEKTAQRISRQIAYLLDKLGLEHTNEVAAAAKIVFYEALLNVFEHAYGEQTGGLVFEAITITPVPRRAQLKKFAYVTEQENSWFENHAGLMLEVAIADYGRNVPSTLWEAYFDIREHLEDFERATSLRLGTHEGKAERAYLHHKIALWAFNHKSTRKREHEFPDKLAQLNWRGLHRALNTAAKFDACVIMRSGQARTGYAFNEGEANALETVEAPQREFPGTSIILRIPLNKPRASSLGRIPKQASSSPTPTIKLKKIVDGSELDGSKLPSDLTDSHTGRAFPIGVVHPFRKYDEGGVMKLRHLMGFISPHIVSIHLFVSLDAEVLTKHLQGFDDKPLASGLGVPRLIAFWYPGHNLQWRFVGLMPEYVRVLVKNIEEHGVANIPSDAGSRSFAEQLAHAYPSFAKIEKDSIHLKQFNYQLPSEDIDQAMQMAFNVWSAGTKESWQFDQSGKYVRLTTGRPVKKYVSLFKMLYSDDNLARAIGWRFATLIRQFQRNHPKLCIVTESEASYFIAKILLQGQNTPIDIYIGAPPVRTASDRPVIVFADAIYRGETLSTLLESLQDCHRVICCLDLRSEAEDTFGEQDIPITSLLKLSFDPEEVELSPTLNASDVLEVDRVTHIPVEGPPTESFLLGTDDRRVFFINENPHLFRYGLHISGGRLHVVSLSNDEIVQKHRSDFFHWIVDIIRFQLEEMDASEQPVDIVFFTRAETSIKDIIEELGAKLPAYVERVGRTFSAVLPFVPTGPREIFSRPTPELYYEVQRLNPTDLLPDHPSHFLAVYLDDACVTGRSLLNLLIRVSKARTDQLPVAIMAIPVLSRFSPAEEQFYSSVFRSVDVMNHNNRRIPFSFNPLFRLQVRSFDKLQSAFVYELAAKMSTQAAFLDTRLQGYVAKVIQRLESTLSNSQRNNSDLAIIQHPFLGRQEANSASVSSRSIRIRHLIALQEQNVGVLGALLHELLDATINDDYSLLTVIALELNLLDVPPLLKECRTDIVDLAIKALTSTETTSETKSDAICVLSMTGQELITEMARILPSIGHDPDLIDQFLVFLLTKVPRTNLWLEDLDNTIRSCASKLPAEEYRYISSYVKSFFEIAEPLNVRSTPDAIRTIENLVAQTSYHGRSLTALNAINDWLSKKERDRISTKGMEVQLKLRAATTVVRRTILPGLDGLVWWAEYENPNQAAAVAFRNARYQLILCLNHLDSIADGLKTGPVGSDVVMSIERLWYTLRDYSQRIGPEYFLSQAVGSPEIEPTILERWMPKFFCLPFQILNRLSPSFLPKVKITNVWQRAGHGFSIMMTPAPLDQITQIFELLLSDMRNHGSDDDNVIELSLDDTDEGKMLVIDFQDRVRQDDAPGTGRSQSKVLSLAEPLGVKVNFDAPRQAGELYRVKVNFTNVLCVKCY